MGHLEAADPVGEQVGNRDTENNEMKTKHELSSLWDLIRLS